MNSNLIKDTIYNYFFPKNQQLIKQLVESFYSLYEDAQDDDQTADHDDLNGGTLDYMSKEKDVPEMTAMLFRENVPSIYAFITDKVPNMIKIGFTDQGVQKRIAQWQKYYPDATMIGHWTATEINAANETVFFKDYPVHARTHNRGFLRINNIEKEEIKKLARENFNLIDMHVSSEFFHKYHNISEDEVEELSEQIIADIIAELKEDIRENRSISSPIYKLVNGESTKSQFLGKPANFSETPLQEDCINNALEAINRGDHDLLMAAVMRFGKTHTAYEIVRRAGFKYVVVTSAKADTRPAWRNDINHVNYVDDFIFLEWYGGSMWITAKNKDGKVEHTPTQEFAPDGRSIIQFYLDQGNTVVVYATLQDLSGELEDEIDLDGMETGRQYRKIKDKHEFLFNNDPDIMIIDETHYGTHSGTLGEVTGLNREMNKDEYDKNEIKQFRQDEKDAQKVSRVISNIKAKVILQCSGTPYYILQSGEFTEFIEGKTIISKVSFTDILKARDEWEEANMGKDDYDPSKSPYFGIPNIYKFGMKLTKKCRKALANESIETKLSKLFENDGETFKYQSAIEELMCSIFGSKDHEMPGFLNAEAIKNKEIFKHIVIVLPHIDDCHLLKELLIDKHIVDENERKIIVAVERRTARSAGGLSLDPIAKDSDTLNSELKRLEKNHKQSVTITVNRFLTGVSVPLWDAMLYMKDSKSPQDYDQAIFRLCTRNTAEIEDQNGNKEKINLKPNVYLIDFNIDRMYQMCIKSVESQCAAKGKVDQQSIMDAIEEGIGNIPMYAEDHVYGDSEQIMDSMHQINAKDLLKTYVNYNKNKSIEEGIDDMFNQGTFDSFANNLENLNLVREFSKSAIGKSGGPQINDEGEDDIELTDDMDFGGDGNENRAGDRSYAGKRRKDMTEEEKKQKKEDDKIRNEIKDRLKGMIKGILYSDICFKESAKDMDDFMKKIEDSENRECLRNFGLDKKKISDVYEKLGYGEKVGLNMMLTQFDELMNDRELKPYERALNAINKLGRLDDKKSEEKEVALVVTPQELVKKMIDKVPEEEMRNAESILEVNSKYGEFLIGIYKKYGKSVAEKVKIVPGDNRCKAFCKKILNLLGISEQNIMEIGDLDGNGKYDVKDFLEMKNEDIISMNKNRRFSVAIGNPPYGSVGGDTLHLKFVDKLLDLCEKQIVVMPFGFITKDTKPFKKYKEKFNKYLINVEEYSSAVFQGTGFPNVAIYEFTDNNDNNIHIQYLDGRVNNINDLLKMSQFTEYEKNIIKYLEQNGQNPMSWAMGRGARSTEIIGLNSIEIEQTKTANCLKSLQDVKKKMKNYKVALIVNDTNGGMNAQFMSKLAGQIFTTYIDLERFFLSKKPGNNIMLFNSKIAAENCKNALKNPLLRFSCYKMQEDQHMTIKKAYKYIPNIDWEDDKVLTDEGLLEVCGCPKEKCHGYAEYCRKYIEENVDNKKK